MTLRVECIDTPAAFAALDAEWTQLDARRMPRVPFGAPLWTRLWWSWFARDGGLVADRLRLYTVRDGTGALVGVAPMMLTCRPDAGLVRSRELQFLGADGNLTELRGPVCVAADEAAV